MCIDQKSIDGWFKEAAGSQAISVDAISIERLSNISMSGSFVYRSSVQRRDDVTLFLLQIDGHNVLVLSVSAPTDLPEEFDGISRIHGKVRMKFCPLTHQNAAALRGFLPYTAPAPLSKKASTFGVGDRLGIAGPGHIRLFKSFKASPVLAQQSVREVELTGRTFEDVLDASTWAVFQEGYKEAWGADGDHLKTEQWVRKAVTIGFTMITADVSDYIRSELTAAPVDTVLENYETIDPHYRERVESFYLDKKWELDCNLLIRFTKEDLARAVVVYREAVDHAKRLYEAALEANGEGSFDFELSVDETPAPTTPQAHIFVAQELKTQGVVIWSVAPRFVGEFQKGIDYIGDVEDFEKTFRIYAAIARIFGHKVSVHSGSDKFSIFPAVGRLSCGEFHVKTSGTNWLLALKVIAQKDRALFLRLYRFALDHFDKARTYYHVTPNLKNVPDPSQLENHDLIPLFNNPDSRQVLHITYGEMFTDNSLKEDIFKTLEQHIEHYYKQLQDHIGDHLRLLGVETEG